MRNDYLSHNSLRYFPRYAILKFVFPLFDSIVLVKFQGYRLHLILYNFSALFGQPLVTSHHFHLIFCDEGIVDYYCCGGSITIITLIAIKIKITIIVITITIIIISIGIIIIIIIIIIIEPTKYLKCCGITCSICFVFCCTLVRSVHFPCCSQ